MNHFTDKAGFNAIKSQVSWRFVAEQPPGDHPFGAYFTPLDPTQRSLAALLRIPKRKLKYYFRFEGTEGLLPLPGERGVRIFYSPGDYVVPPSRQVYHGSSGL